MQEQGETPQGLSVQLFGPLEIFVGGVKLVKSRTVHDHWLLALLLLEGDAMTHAPFGDPTPGVARDFLADALWPGKANGDDYLKTSLRLLRHALGPETQRIATPRGKLRLDISGVACDWLTFQHCARSDDPELMRQAAELYRPPLIEGCTDLWVLPFRKKAGRMFAGVAQKLASLCEAEHDFEAATDYIRRAWQEDTEDEDLLGRYMRLLQRMGRYVEINSTFGTLLDSLQKRGETASPEIRKLYRILWSHGQAEARASATNGRRVPHLMMHGFPNYHEDFVGRESDIQTLISELEGTQVVSVVGAGGVGKTRLSAEAVLCLLEQNPDDFQDGAYFVELGDLTDADFIAWKIASMLKVPPGKATDMETALVRNLEPKSVLLVLNNCEHLARRCARLVGRLAAGCHRLRVLVTSRRRLGLESELPLPLAPLAYPPADCAAADLESYASVQLLLRRTGREKGSRADGQIGFSLEETDTASITQICNKLEGIPFLIELAAAQSKTLDLGRVAEGVNTIFRSLRRRRRTALRHQETVRAMMEWSYDLLETDAQRALLPRLSVFSGGWTVEAAAAVCLNGTTDVYGADDELAELAEDSLIYLQADRRYRMLEMVKQFGAESLDASGEEHPVRERHLDYFLALAEGADGRLRSGEQEVALRELDAEHDNLRSALLWATTASQQAEAGLRMAAALGAYWETRNHLEEGLRWYRATLERTKEGTPTRAEALRGAGILAFRRGLYPEALGFCNEALHIKRASGDSAGTAPILNTIGNVYADMQQSALALQSYHDSLKACPEKDRRARASTLGNIGLTLCECERYDEAAPYLEESLTIRRAIRDTLGVAAALLNLGYPAFHQGRYGDARRFATESLTLNEAMGDKRGSATALVNLAALARAEKSEEAAGILEQCIHACRELSASVLVPFILEACGELSVNQGRMAAAARLYGAAGRLRETRNTPLPAADQGGLDTNVSKMRAVLEEEVFLGRYNEGREMTLEQALGFALETLRGHVLD